MKQSDIDHLTLAPGKSERIFFDDRIRGLGYRLRKSGARSWIVQRRDQAGVSHRVTIDRGGTLPLADARELAIEQIAWITLGRDISAEKRLIWTETQLRKIYAQQKEGQLALAIMKELGVSLDAEPHTLEINLEELDL